MPGFEEFLPQVTGVYGFEFLGRHDCLYEVDVEGSLRRDVRLALNRWIYTHTRLPVNVLYQICELRRPNGTAMPADPALEAFCLEQLSAVSQVELIPSGYRLTFAETASPYVVFTTRIRVSRWMQANDRDYEIQWRARRGATNRLVTLSEYPRRVERVQKDAEFEKFCLAVPGVQSVERRTLNYRIVVNSRDTYPVQRHIYRWMAHHGRHFDTTFSGISRRRASSYGGLDRVVSTFTYRPPPDGNGGTPDPLASLTPAKTRSEPVARLRTAVFSTLAPLLPPSRE